MNEIYQLAEVERPAKPLHSLRQSFGTLMAKQVPLPVLQRLLGHADIKTTLRYIDVGENDKRDAIAQVFGGARPAVAATRQRESSKRS
ncbi:MAG: tyrosine-type recombinase/integrase [Deltaproteobacteria bacterium]